MFAGFVFGRCLSAWWVGCAFGCGCLAVVGGLTILGVENEGLKTVKNGPRVWAFCKIEFPGIQKPVQFFGQKSGFFKNPGNRGVGVIWLVRGLFLVGLCCLVFRSVWFFMFCGWVVGFVGCC